VWRPEGRRPLEDLGIEGRIILQWIFQKWVVEEWTGLLWIRVVTGDSSCECDNEPSDFIKYGEFLDYLRNC
jgi:hypothetical protein